MQYGAHVVSLMWCTGWKYIKVHLLNVPYVESTYTWCIYIIQYTWCIYVQYTWCPCSKNYTVLYSLNGVRVYVECTLVWCTCWFLPYYGAHVECSLWCTCWMYLFMEPMLNVPIMVHMLNVQYYGAHVNSSLWCTCWMYILLEPMLNVLYLTMVHNHMLNVLYYGAHVESIVLWCPWWMYLTMVPIYVECSLLWCSCWMYLIMVHMLNLPYYGAHVECTL